ncbi:MAG: glycosyltransferase [Anaerolineae bacterium]
MLQTVELPSKALRDYGSLVGDEVIEEIQGLAQGLQGARVLHLSATAYGGGVAELLYTLVPLMRDAGLEAEWQVMMAEQEFFTVTKALHNTLQGMSIELTKEMVDIYLRNNERNAALLELDHDFVVIHDPQPAAILHFHGRAKEEKWIWRCHIDTSTPNHRGWKLLKAYVEPYDAAVFHLARYAGDLKFERLAVIPPSIDPLSDKNRPLSLEESRQILARFGIDTDRPLMTQVSRFDPWKDPLGVIDAYRLVKAVRPEVQLALVGAMALDDPEGIHFYARTLRHAGEDFDIHILSNLDGVGNLEVNAFQNVSDVIIQKSTREGFGLVVTEALWKGKPVIGGNVGGIPLQVIDGETGFLVASVQDCAQKALYLLDHREEAKGMGTRAKEHVRRHFLCTRHLKDYLELFATL